MVAIFIEVRLEVCAKAPPAPAMAAKVSPLANWYRNVRRRGEVRVITILHFKT